MPDRQPRIELTVFDDPVIAARLADTILPSHRGEIVQLVEDPTRPGTVDVANYIGLAMKLSADAGAVNLVQRSSNSAASGRSRCSSWIAVR